MRVSACGPNYNFGGLVGFTLSFLALISVAPAVADEYFITIDHITMTVDGEITTGIGMNGSIPGPTLRWHEGEEVTIHVTNNLDEDSSIHWHGILLPSDMDGVPGFSFDGIQPGETFTYSFTVRQYGTYWYHSHSGFQEQEGVFGALVVDPAAPDPVAYDREYVIVLSDWLNEDPRNVLRNLKGSAEYYNYNRRTVGDFFRDMFSARNADERNAAIQDRLDWGQMRMDPTDIADISGYTYLLNGWEADDNWTALFEAGERVRLRFINASAMTYYDVGIPGLPMHVVNADGNNVVPVPVEEIRIAVAETYDVIVEPQADQAYTIFAQARSREGFARGTLTPREGMQAPVPPLSEREVLTMASMGPAAHGGMGAGDHSGHNRDATDTMTDMDMGATNNPHAGHAMPIEEDPHAGHDMSGASEMTMPGIVERLSYNDLVALEPYAGAREPDRVIDVRLTGNMHRYFWTINDVAFDEAEPIQLTLGERVRIRFVNETMMDHPMHLHGMWMDLQNGNGDRNPRKHTISIGPGNTVEADVTVDAVGQWAFHCHLIFHMDTGMMRRVVVAETVES
jgi:L-ascorbate oxidase